MSYTPQHNDVSKRKNKTILNMVWSLLARGKVSKTFLARSKLELSHLESKSHTCSSRCDARGGLKWKKTIYRSLQNFWMHCLCSCSRCKKKKLDNKGEKCVLLGVN